MAKRLKATKNTRKEGGEAALSGHARSSNPYPSSDTARRNEWFAGYDAAVTVPKRAKG